MTFFSALRHLHIVCGLSLFLTMLVAFVLPTLHASAQQAPLSVDARTYAMPPVEPTEYNGDVRDLEQVTYTVPRYYHMWNEFEEPQRIKPPALSNQATEPTQPVISLAPMPAATLNFAGIGFGDGVNGGQAGAGWPPDTNGDVGPTVYIQAVNDAFGIFNKTTGSRLAAFTEDSLWNAAGTGTPCHSNNEGDPVVLHDGLADRWILTNFAFAFDSNGNPVAPFYECIAVSKTNDPVAGGWFFYAVKMDTGGTGAPPAGTLNDYPKFGLWTDCLYMGANGFDATQAKPPFVGAIIATFSRAAIFAGQALSASNSAIGFLSGSSAPFTMVPANLLGTVPGSQPPSGTPEYFVDESATVFAWEVRKFVQGANVCGAGSSLSAATNVNQASYGYPADVANTTTNIVAQKSTTNAVDSLGDRLMQKVQYRKIGSAESLWVVHTTCGTSQSANGTCVSNTTTTRPQWTQINVTNKTIATTPAQQQIYAPDTTLYRWMGSLAVDGQGNMALGYSTSSATAFPGIAYSGRLVTDAANQLPQSQTVLTTGAGSQTNLNRGTLVSRWGDYSAMSIDPADDCTFWYTNLFYDTTAHGSSGTWQTRIGAFKFPGCVSVGVATKLAFTLQPNASYASGAAITVKVSVENAAGSVITTDTSAVTLALSGGTAGASLSGTKTVNAVAGVATFSGLSVDKVGAAYQLNATDGSLAAATSSAFNITVGAAKTVTFTTQPATNSNVAAVATIPLVAHVVDSGGNAVSGQSIALAIGTNAGGSTLSVAANPVATDASGNATFASVSLNKVGSGYTLTATDNTTPAATAATSNDFNIVAGAAKTVTFTTQPATNSNVMAGATIPLVAHVVDGGGNAVSAQSITLAIGNNAGSSTLSVSANPVPTDTSGNATFANLSLNRSGTSYTLTATDTTTPTATTATSNAFNIVAAAAKTMTFTTQPATNSDVPAGTTIPLVAHVLDASGNAVAGDNITLSIGTNSGGSTLTVTTNPVATNASGDATFAGVSLNKVGSNYTLKATDGSTPALTATSNTFNMTIGLAAGLSFTVEPSETTPGVAISPAVQVSLVDASGNVETDDSTDSITLALVAGIDPTFTGGGPIQLVNGVASFPGIALTVAASGFQLGATTTAGSFSATSNPFMVSATGMKLAFVQPPVDVAQGMTETVQVAVEDASSNILNSDNMTSITLTVPACSATVTIGTATVVGGVAMFNYKFYAVAALNLTASSSNAGSDSSSVFNVTANPDLLFADGFDGCRP
jgi:hypothetical protein